MEQESCIRPLRTTNLQIILGTGAVRDGDDPPSRATNDGEQEAHQRGTEATDVAPRRYT